MAPYSPDNEEPRPLRKRGENLRETIAGVISRF